MNDINNEVNMVDLLISYPSTNCDKCGRRTECVRVWVWDDSFCGVICWDDFRRMVRENSKDQEARKKYAAARAEQLARRTTATNEDMP